MLDLRNEKENSSNLKFTKKWNDQLTCGIYMLRSPSGKRYIGSSKNIEGRWKDHAKRALAGKHCNKALTAAYKKYGFLEQIILLECSSEELLIHEQRFLDDLKPEYNLSGIAGKIEMTPEVVQKITANTKSCWADPEYSERQRELLKSRQNDPEYRDRQTSSANTLWQSDQFRERKSASSKLHWENPDYRARYSEGSKLYWSDPEVRIKKSKDSKAYWSDPEVRARKSAEVKLWHQNKKLGTLVSESKDDERR